MAFIERIVNVQTGEIIEKEFTKKQTDEMLAEIAKAEELRLKQEEMKAARESAISKLSALGLTPEEIKALAG